MNDHQLIEQAYDAFNARNIDAALKLMHPQVKWPRAWEGDHAIGHEEVCSYWTRQWQEIDPVVTPIHIGQQPDGTFTVTVHQVVRDLDGNLIFDGTVLHLYTISNGLIKQMVIGAV